MRRGGISETAMVAIVVTIVVVTGVSAVVLLGPKEVAPFAKEKYVFAEIWHNTTGEVIEGDGNAFVFMDFPFYSFNNATGILHVEDPYWPLSNDFWIAIGEGYSLSGGAGSGISSSVNWVDSTPSDDVAGLMVTSLSSDGTISLTYNGKNIKFIEELHNMPHAAVQPENTLITLAPGQKWENVTTWTASVTTSGGGSWCLIRYTTTVTIRNYGLQNKDDIITV